MKIYYEGKYIKQRLKSNLVKPFSAISKSKLIAKYKFNKSIYDNLIPEFNVGFADYKIVDDLYAGNIVIRSIYSEELPTVITFGSETTSNRESSLLEVMYLCIDNVIDMGYMFCNCSNLISVNSNGWNANKVTNMEMMFYGCNNLNTIMMNNSDYSSVNKIISALPTKTVDNLGALDIAGVDDVSLVNVNDADNKYWTISSIYIMSKEYDATKTDLDNLKLALKSNKEYIYLDKDMSLEEGTPDTVYFYINRPVYIYSNLENVLDVAIRITANNVTLNRLYLTREVRPNSSFNNLTVKNCIINGSSAMGLHLLVRGEGTVCKNITIENCEFKNNAWHGIAFKGVIPSENKPSNGGDGTGQGTFENVIIRNCKSYNNGYVVQEDGTIVSDHEYSAGIDLVDSCYKMKNCIVENCESYNNYSNGFHMESVAIKTNVRIVNCKAYNNGKNPGGPHFGCGFSVIDEGVVLENCISENNTVANYTSLKNQAHSPYKHYTGTLINCYDNKILINWNEEIANQVYNGDNLIYNGDFKYGSMHYGFYYSTYCCWFYNMPNFLKRNGNETAYYESGIHMDNMNKPFIHGKFMTNLFKLKGNKKYKLSVKVDNSKNINNEELVIGLFKFNYVSDKSTKLNLRDESINKTLIKNSDCNSNLTTYTFEIDSDSVNNFVDGHYLLFFRNSSINSDSPMSLDGINPDELNIKIYDIKLEEIGFSSSIIAIYQTSDINELPVFNDGYNYTITSTETISNNLYRVTLSSTNNFSSCNFENNTALCNVEYLKITNNVNSLYRLFYGCTNLENVDFSHWDTTEVETISQMFKNCDKLISLDLEVLNGKNIENFLGLFEGCDNLETVNMSGLITNKATTIRGLFYDCKSLTTIMLSRSDMTNITNIQNTCGSAKNINTVYAKDCSEGSLATILEFLPEKTSNAPGVIYVSDIDIVSQTDIATAQSKYWNIEVVQSSFVLGKSKLGIDKL